MPHSAQWGGDGGRTPGKQSRQGQRPGARVRTASPSPALHLRPGTGPVARVCPEAHVLTQGGPAVLTVVLGLQVTRRGPPVQSHCHSRYREGCVAWRPPQTQSLRSVSVSPLSQKGPPPSWEGGCFLTTDSFRMFRGRSEGAAGGSGSERLRAASESASQDGAAGPPAGAAGPHCRGAPDQSAGLGLDWKLWDN